MALQTVHNLADYDALLKNEGLVVLDFSAAWWYVLYSPRRAWVLNCFRSLPARLVSSVGAVADRTFNHCHFMETRVVVSVLWLYAVLNPKPSTLRSNWNRLSQKLLLIHLLRDEIVRPLHF
jgi:hypothetical protein